MLGASRVIYRAFALPTLTAAKKLIFSHPYVARLDLEERPVNDEVAFEGLATLVDWRERVMGKCDLAKIKELAAEKQLQYLLLNDKPPIVQLVNYWKVLYKAAMHISEGMRRKEAHNVKTIVIQNKILKHDLQVKLSKVQDQLEKGNKVVVTVASKHSGNADDIAQAKQIGKAVKEHFSSVSGCEIDIENTDEGANVSLDLPMQNLQKTEVETFLDNPEVSKLAGLGRWAEVKTRKKKQFEPIYSKQQPLEIIDFKRVDTPDEDELRQKLQTLDEVEEAKEEYTSFIKRKEHEKKMKKRIGASLNINKSQAKFS